MVPPETPIPFRVLILWPEQWPRALLRAELRERGYDAMGATDILAAMRYSERDPERGPVRPLIIDSSALESPILVQRFKAHHPGCRSLLIAPAGRGPPPGEWDVVLRRPLSVGTITRSAIELLGPEGGRASD